MSLLGQAAMVFWHDIADGDDDYKDWHSNEHMTERVGCPGFSGVEEGVHSAVNRGTSLCMKLIRSRS